MSDNSGVPASPSMGLKSSEFISMVTTMIGLCLGVVPDKYAPLVAAIVGLYVACRTLLKVVHNLGLAKQIPDLPEPPVIQSPLPGTITTTITPKQ